MSPSPVEVRIEDIPVLDGLRGLARSQAAFRRYVVESSGGMWARLDAQTSGS